MLQLATSWLKVSSLRASVDRTMLRWRQKCFHSLLCFNIKGHAGISLHKEIKMLTATILWRI